jgi:hypothetical protein
MEVLTDQEIDSLVMALANGQETFTETDAKIAIDWAHKIKVDAVLLGMVFKGKLKLTIENGQIRMFRKEEES